MPSKPHPLISEFDNHLCRLRVSEAASLSPSLTGNRLNGIQDLHDCVNKLLQLSFTQQALAQEQHKTWVDELLHESLRLLDLCGIAKDALLQTKECTHQLLSIMRRRWGRMVCEDAKTNTNELEKAHAELQFLIVHITRKSDCAVYLENIQNLLEKSESSI
ncbi:hypothetical protein RGQ29_018474 [Quercus rubra]|uniref:Uncharacterized protein n=1 Tax=Quercus rubra TaxID=3512 RepID=A0AAN7J250_QUERU|nr:hypothetical protein RGQ29_018474 [Quercus rubra]